MPRSGCDCEYCRGNRDGDYDIGYLDCSDRAVELRSQRRFGVELETSESSGYGEWIDSTKWGAKYDGSISGKEFVSPVLRGDDGLASVRQVCGYMDCTDFAVDRSCGFHLHCDLNDTSAAQRKAIALAYCYTAEVWEEFTASHRRDGSYCRKNNGYWDSASIIAGSDYPSAGNRYIWLNWAAFDEHGTVEVRSHEGTLDSVAVCNWVKAHLRFIDYVAKMTPAQVMRVFGGKTKAQMFSELTKIWDDSALTDYYGRKSGLRVAETAECAEAV